MWRHATVCDQDGYGYRWNLIAVGGAQKFSVGGGGWGISYKHLAPDLIFRPEVFYDSKHYTVQYGKKRRSNVSRGEGEVSGVHLEASQLSTSWRCRPVGSAKRRLWTKH